MATEISNKLKDNHNKEYILKQLHDFYKYVKPYSGPDMTLCSKKNSGVKWWEFKER